MTEKRRTEAARALLYIGGCLSSSTLLSTEMEEKMMQDGEVSVTEHAVPVPKTASVLEEAAAPELHFNSCPSGWFSHGSRCFQLIPQFMNWFSAEEHCNSLGGHLASAANPAEYSFLQRMSKTAGQGVAWLGGFNLQGRWMWIDRQGFYYTNWHSLPSSSSSSSSPCVFLRSSNRWGNNNCNTGCAFICSKNPFSC